MSETQTHTPGLSEKGKMSETPTETLSEHPETNVRSDTQSLPNIDDLLLPTERETPNPIPYPLNLVRNVLPLKA